MTPSEPVAIPAAVADAMRTELPSVAQATVAEIIVEVPSYADAFQGDMGRVIGNAVELALGGFLELATASGVADAGTPIRPALDGAYELGRGEARSGRSMDALLAAYRVGARVSWRYLSASAVSAGLTVQQLARFAELVFAYIDQLSAASVAGHSDELETTGRVRTRYLERLAGLLLDGRPLPELTAAAERADWALPRTLTAVILPETAIRGALLSLDGRTLRSNQDVPGLDSTTELVVLLVPDARRCCARWTAATPSWGRPARGRRRTRPTCGPAGRCSWGWRRRDPSRSTPISGWPTWCSGRTAKPSPTCARGCWRRSTTSPPPHGRSWWRRCAPGCCTTAGASRSRPRCSCIHRPSATGWGSSGSTTGRGWSTRRPCSS
jgi:hypothetical protein